MLNHDALHPRSQLQSDVKMLNHDALHPRSQLQSDYYVRDELVYYQPNVDTPATLHVPNSDTAETNKLIGEIIAEFHAGRLAGHLGERKTTDRIKQFFHWSGMRKTVEDYTLHCRQCQHAKPRMTKPVSSARPFAIPLRPWEIISADEKSGMPTSKDGNNAYWVFVDASHDFERGYFDVLWWTSLDRDPTE